MSRQPGRHAKVTSGYEGRHSKPGTPGPAALLGTAAKVVPASLVAGAAGSALALSGTASAATGAPGGPVHSIAPDLATVKIAAPRFVLTKVHHAAKHSSAYTVISGDTLSGISAKFCGTSADFPSLAAASGITNADVIYPGEHIRLNCHAPAPAPVAASAPRRARHPRAASPIHTTADPVHRARHARPEAGGSVSTA